MRLLARKRNLPNHSSDNSGLAIANATPSPHILLHPLLASAAKRSATTSAITVHPLEELSAA